MKLLDNLLAEKDLQGANSGAKLERELQVLSASNSQSIAIVAHDLRGAVSTVIGFLSLLNHSFKTGQTVETQLYTEVKYK